MSRTRRVVAVAQRLPAAALVLLVRAYQLLLSPMFGPVCRFYPSCSHYAVGALRTHGAVRGTVLTLWRLARCNPWNAGGVDDVPPRRHTTADHRNAPSVLTTASATTPHDGAPARPARAA